MKLEELQEGVEVAAGAVTVLAKSIKEIYPHLTQKQIEMVKHMIWTVLNIDEELTKNEEINKKMGRNAEKIMHEHFLMHCEECLHE